jgi:hypothetical protein
MQSALSSNPHLNVLFLHYWVPAVSNQHSADNPAVNRFLDKIMIQVIMVRLSASNYMRAWQNHMVYGGWSE